MLAWIWSNKEWLFSGVGVALVAALIALLRRAGRSKKEVTDLAPGEILQVVLSKPAVPEQWEPIPSDVSPKQVVEAIEQAPLLQQPDVEKHYRGVSVEWEGQLIGAWMNDTSSVRLLLASGEGGDRPSIGFEVDPSAYAGLGLLKKGDLIRVVGKIDSIDHPIIHLAEARLVKYGSITV